MINTDGHSQHDDKTIYVTQEGYQKLVEELEYLETVKRKQIAERIKEAASYGDLSENSEYEEAKNEQAQMEGKILLLTEQVKYAKVIDEESAHATGKNARVQLGSTVKIKALNGKYKGETYEYSIVGTTEADPFNNKISNESPLGMALIDAKTGEKIVVKAPVGDIEYEVLKIQ